MRGLFSPRPPSDVDPRRLARINWFIIIVVLAAVIGLNLWGRKWAVKNLPVAHPFLLKTVDNRTVDPLTYSGKYLVLYFWMKKCPLCVRLEQETLVPLWKDHPKWLEILGVCLDPVDDEEALLNLRRVIEERGIAFPVAYATDQEIVELAKGYSIKHLPFLVVIDPRGRVRKRFFLVSKDQLMDTLKVLRRYGV